MLRNNPDDRFLLGIWILTVMVISASYSGELKAYLTRSDYTKPINTLVDLIASGLLWQMVLYGEDFETVMATTDDPVLKRIWKHKMVVEFAANPDVNNSRIFSESELYRTYV